MVVVAHSVKEARQLAKKKIKDEELQEDYPVLDVHKYNLDVGIKYEFETDNW